MSRSTALVRRVPRKRRCDAPTALARKKGPDFIRAFFSFGVKERGVERRG
jgi:hypothetical protein